MSSPKRFDKEEYERLIESIYDFQVSSSFTNSESDIAKVMDVLSQIRKMEIDFNLPHHFYSDDYGEEDSESESDGDSSSLVWTTDGDHSDQESESDPSEEEEG